MSFTLVLAVSRNGVIGCKDAEGKDIVPWRLPNDMKHFRSLTMGKNVIMGRKTWDSLPGAYKPLPGRVNWVITRNPENQYEGANTCASPINIVGAQGGKEWMVIGGSEIYEYFLPYADVIEMTIVEADFEGDAFFKKHLNENWNIGWHLEHVRHFVADEKHAYPYSFCRFVRIRSGVQLKETVTEGQQ